MMNEFPSLDELNQWRDEDGEDLVEGEFDAFRDWMWKTYVDLEPEDYERGAFCDLFKDWRCSPAYEQWH